VSFVCLFLNLFETVKNRYEAQVIFTRYKRGIEDVSKGAMWSEVIF
jgi:hypothetical protein